jgi:hypothetical protein
MSDDDRLARERARLLGTEAAIPTSRLTRLWRTGRAAASLATATLGGRLRGRGGGLAAAEIEDVVRLVSRLGELKGVAMKAGQILGYVDPTLAPELRDMLSLLQTTSAAAPFEAVAETVRAAFGPRAETLLAGLVREPIAVASIGQVHRGRVDGIDVAVKVRHAGIEAALQADSPPPASARRSRTSSRPGLPRAWRASWPRREPPSSRSATSRSRRGGRRSSRGGSPTIPPSESRRSRQRGARTQC